MWKLFLALIGMAALSGSPDAFGAAIAVGVLLFVVGIVAVIVCPPQWGRRR